MTQPRDLMPDPGRAITLTIRRMAPDPHAKVLESYAVDVTEDPMNGEPHEIGRIHVRDPRTFLWESAVNEDWAGGDASFPTSLHNLFRTWWNR